MHTGWEVSGCPSLWDVLSCSTGGWVSSQGWSSFGGCGLQASSFSRGCRVGHCIDPSCWDTISEGCLKPWAVCMLGGGTWPLREGETGVQWEQHTDEEHSAGAWNLCGGWFRASC